MYNLKNKIDRDRVRTQKYRNSIEKMKARKKRAKLSKDDRKILTRKIFLMNQKMKQVK